MEFLLDKAVAASPMLALILGLGYYGKLLEQLVNVNNTVRYPPWKILIFSLLLFLILICKTKYCYFLLNRSTSDYFYLHLPRK